ncbi:MAG: cation:proton antiporter [Pseudomonadales bacterium]|jgi:CPA2 family monovalent cation:H+ antiporter-2|nr:cation:proton antiporter [Pseudomonadales bacterium]
MPHDVSLISALAYGFGAALLLGFLASSLRLPALIGYLVAGILVGPVTPGFVTDAHIASQLSEIGVMLLMFGVGLHFSLSDLLSVRRIALPGALVQISIATLLSVGLALWWGWDLAAGLVFGLSLSVASTVVLLKGLELHGALDSINGRIALGWLVVEDLVMVLVLVLLPAFAAITNPGAGAITAPDKPLWQTLATTVLLVSLFIALMLVAGRKLMPRLLWLVAQTGSRELFTLTVVAIAISIAYIASKVFGLSFALGAFISGMVMRESEFSHRAAEESLPLRDAFSVLFFVGVGTLFDPRVLVDHTWEVLAVLGIIFIGKTLSAAALTLLFRYPLKTALTIAAGLAQVGEFSFILAGLGVTLGILPAAGQSLILAGALLSIALNPFLFALINPLDKWALAHFGWARRLAIDTSPLATLPMETAQKYLQGHVVVVGYGRVGTRVCNALELHGIPCVVVEQRRDLVEKLRQTHLAVVAGDAADPQVLIQAHIARAAMLVIAAPDATDVHSIVDTATALNAAIRIVLRTHSLEEAQLWRSEAIGEVFYDSEELSKGIITHALRQFQPQPEEPASAADTTPPLAENH